MEDDETAMIRKKMEEVRAMLAMDDVVVPSPRDLAELAAMQAAAERFHRSFAKHRRRSCIGRFFPCLR